MQIYLYGEPRELRLTDEANAAVVFDGDEIVAPRGTDDQTRMRLLWFVAARTEEIVRRLVPEWSRRLAVRPRSAAVKYVRSRWGSCTARGDLAFSSRLSMLSPDVAEYVVVHELCHLKRMDHSPSFWAEVEAALPGAMAIRRRLRKEEPRCAI